jgi:hypothetical protein
MTGDVQPSAMDTLQVASGGGLPKDQPQLAIRVHHELPGRLARGVGLFYIFIDFLYNGVFWMAAGMALAVGMGHVFIAFLLPSGAIYRLPAPLLIIEFEVAAPRIAGAKPESNYATRFRDFNLW